MNWFMVIGCGLACVVCLFMCEWKAALGFAIAAPVCGVLCQYPENN